MAKPLKCAFSRHPILLVWRILLLPGIFLIALFLFNLQSAVQRLPPIYSMLQGGICYAQFFRKLRHGERFAFVAKQSVPGTIIGLCFCIHPSAVLRAIVPVYIDTVYSERVIVPIGQSPCTEGKVLVPLRADRDAFSAVLKPSRVLRVIATSAHVLPGIIKSFFM